MTPTPYFTTKTFQFLKELAANNRRDWFAENKARYEDEVSEPLLACSAEVAGPLGKRS